MNRKTFIKQISLTAAAMTITDLRYIAQSLEDNGTTMPVLFVGHGNPMNAIEENEFTRGWKEIAKAVPKPKIILFISAHWLTKGTYVSSVKHPETIHDFGGFPQSLFDVQYPAEGSPELAKTIRETITDPVIELDTKWGLDHGAWSVAKPMYPDADIPALQLSIDYYKPGQYHYDLAKQLQSLRKKGVLIIGSGNMIHHLGLVNFRKEGGEDWAIELNELFKTKITNGDHASLINYEKLHANIKLAVPTPDHYYPLLYSLGLQQKNETIQIFNDKTINGSLSMTSIKIG